VASGQSITLTFELKVADSNALSATDSCKIVVTGAAVSDRDGDGVSDDQDAYPDDASQWEQNHPPLQPAITCPANGATSVDLTPVLYASAFSDANTGDKHSKSQWLIVSKKNQKTVLQVTRSGYYMTYYRVPLLVLGKNTEYTCQVRYFDSHGLASQWSSAVAFTTRSSLYSLSGALPDTPGDTALLDLNANGLADAQESEVLLSTTAYDKQHALAASIEGASENIASIDDLASIDPNAEEPLPPVQDIGPYGLISYCIQVPEVGQAASVRLYFSEPIDPQAAWIVQGADGTWQESTDAQIQPQADGASVVRLVKDGGESDLDGVANGTIIDMVAPREAAAEAPQDTDTNATPNTNAGGSHTPMTGSCFIDSLLE
jgi:hypothetical protein